jgi:hypothetical protein
MTGCVLTSTGNRGPLISPGPWKIFTSTEKEIMSGKILYRGPVCLEEGNGWQLFQLPTHEEHTYNVHRYHFDTEVEIEASGKFHVMMLVEGSSVITETRNGMIQRFNYAETFVVTAASGACRIRNESGNTAVLLAAFMK